jgi:hypothetical protein
MAVNDVALALIELHNPAVRKKVAEIRAQAVEQVGYAVNATHMSDAEAQLITDAAMDEPQTLSPADFDIVPSRFYPSLSYIADHREQLSPDVRKKFNEFFQRTYGVAWTIALMG